MFDQPGDKDLDVVGSQMAGPLNDPAREYMINPENSAEFVTGQIVGFE